MVKKVYVRKSPVAAAFALSVLLVFLLPFLCRAAEPGSLPAIWIYSKDIHPVWAHQDLTFHFLIPADGDYKDYELEDLSGITVWRSTDGGENWYNITGSPDALLTSTSLVVSNLEDAVLTTEKGYFFQLEFPPGREVDPYSDIIRVVLTGKEDLSCSRYIGGDRGGGNRHDRPPSAILPPDETLPPDDTLPTDETLPADDTAETPDSSNESQADSVTKEQIPEENTGSVSNRDASASNTEEPDSGSLSAAASSGSKLSGTSSSHKNTSRDKTETLSPQAEKKSDRGMFSRYAAPALGALAAGVCAGTIFIKKRKR